MELRNGFSDPHEILDECVEVRLRHAADFSVIRETLTRIGVATKNRNVLYQNCYILSKFNRSKYYIVNYKEMLRLDGQNVPILDEDIAQTNSVANILAEWKLIILVDPMRCKSPLAPRGSIKIISHKEKGHWHLVPMYSIGKTN